MPIDMNSLWDLKITTDWKILGRRRMMRLQCNLQGSPNICEEREKIIGLDDGSNDPAVSSDEAWKLLGRRRSYRSLLPADPVTLKSSSSLNHTVDFAKVQQEKDRNCPVVQIPDDQIQEQRQQVRSVEGQDIVSLYFQEEMKRFQ